MRCEPLRDTDVNTDSSSLFMKSRGRHGIDDRAVRAEISMARVVELWPLSDLRAECGAKGNQLDLWAMLAKKPLYQAVLDLCDRSSVRVPRLVRR